MLKQGYIRHTVNKSSFSEQCYYVMSPLILELCGNLSALNIDDNLDSVSERAAAVVASTAATATAGNVVLSDAQGRPLNNHLTGEAGCQAGEKKSGNCYDPLLQCISQHLMPTFLY